MDGPGGKNTIQISREFATLVVVFLVFPWLLLALIRHPKSQAPTPGPHTENASSNRVFSCKPGPWGEIECTRIHVEPPEEFISGDNFSESPILWVLKGYSRQKLETLLDAAKLPIAQKTSLLSKAEFTTAGVILHPDKKLVLELTRDQRTEIYNALSAFHENQYQHYPFRFRAETSHEWFEHSSVSQDAQELVSSLVYRKGTSLLFSDVNLVLPMLPKGPERRKLLKTLARESSLLMKLTIHEGEDVSALVSYWGRGGRNKDIRPLLESLAKVPVSEDIDICHMLPRFARSRLYTYPLPSDDPIIEKRDCYWTCMNFFNDIHDDKYTNIAEVRREMAEHYFSVPANPIFGDMVVFYQSNGEAIHSAIYIADNILFTKNGPSYSMPWILMSMEDLMAFYPSETPLMTKVYRRKDL